MGRSEYSFDQSATVKSSPEAVMAWWFHEDRRPDFEKRIEESGAKDISFTYSRNEEAAVREARWTTARGWNNEHRTETRVPLGGTVPRAGNRFVAPTGEVATYRSPSGQERKVTCIGHIEFIPKKGGVTTVRVFHHHVLEGGTRLQRWAHRVKERENTDRLFWDWAAKRRAAVKDMAPLAGSSDAP